MVLLVVGPFYLGTIISRGSCAYYQFKLKEPEGVPVLVAFGYEELLARRLAVLSEIPTLGIVETPAACAAAG